MKPNRKKLIKITLLCCTLIVVGLFVVNIIFWPKPSSSQKYILTISIEQENVSGTDFVGGKPKATVFFTNNSKKPVEFVTDGSSFFQFLDIAVVDQQGKNWVDFKYGDIYQPLIQDGSKTVVKPGETIEGAIVIAMAVQNQPLRGTYNVQAILRYQNLEVGSNVVQLTIEP